MGNVAFIDILDIRNSNDKENIGICMIAAYLRIRGISVDLFSFTTFDDILDASKQEFYEYKIYGFSIYPNTASKVFEYAKDIKAKNPNCYIYVGGVLATIAAKEILGDCRYIDFVTLGYGEIPLLEVVKRIEAGCGINGIPSVFSRENTHTYKQINYVDPNEMPWPARDYLEESIKSGNFTARLNTSLGCYGSCAFCSVNSYYCYGETKWLGRKMKDVFDEIVWLNKHFGVKSFVFNDASFEDPPNTKGRDRIGELCKLILEQPDKFAFRFSMRAESFTDNDGSLLKLMRQAGFTHVFLGIESGSQYDLKIYNKRATVQDNMRALKLFNKYDIDVTMGFIMINPFSNKDSINHNYQFLKENGASRLDMFTRNVDVYFLTSMHQKLKDAGLLTNDFCYRNPYGYIYADKYIKDLDELFNVIREDSFLSEQDGKVLQMSYLLSTLKAIYGDRVSSYLEHFRGITNKLSDVMADYFGIILEDYNIEKASSRFGDFKSKLGCIYEELNSFTLRLLYNRTLREFFFVGNYKI